jgi:rRNA processing protein Krr1/Pno1
MGNEQNTVQSREDKITKAMSSFMKMNYPKFSKESVTFHITKQGYYYHNIETNVTFCAVDLNQKRVLLNGKIIDKLNIVFGKKIIYFIDWFNKEFDQDIIELC